MYHPPARMPSGREQMPGWQGGLPQRPKPNMSKPHPTLSLLSCAKCVSPQPLFRAQAPDSGGVPDSSQVSHNRVMGKSCPLRLQNIFRRKPLLPHYQPGSRPHHLEPQLAQGSPRCHLPPYTDSRPSSPTVPAQCKLDRITALLRTSVAPASPREKPKSLQRPSGPQDLRPFHCLSDCTSSHSTPAPLASLLFLGQSAHAHPRAFAPAGPSAWRVFSSDLSIAPLTSFKALL